ncbi:MAG TPA: LytTR family DNA-binding domain-containing protein [Haliangiales bacterium]|nr:LytTR family DNA-binding domain-containing protein [Haliangiales bacterium]
MPLATLIVDDEPLAREGLRALLAEDPEVTAIDEARNGREAVAALARSRPDLVFLDVQMPEMDGIAVVRAVGAERMPAVVFVTAHDRYALHAFELNAIDYVLKPVTRERFAQALARAKARLAARSAEDAQGRILGLLETLASRDRRLRRLAVRSAGKTLFLDVRDIDWIQAAENYVELHVGGASHLLHVTMNALEKSLDPGAFVRVHRSIIVNIARIASLEPAPHGEHVIVLAGGTRLRSSRTYAARLKALAANPF